MKLIHRSLDQSHQHKISIEGKTTRSNNSNYSFKDDNDIEKDHCKGINIYSINNKSFILSIVHIPIQVTPRKPKGLHRDPLLLYSRVKRSRGDVLTTID